MDLDYYNRSFEAIVDHCEEDADNHLRSVRQKWIRDFIERINSRQKEWDETFQELLRKSQDISEIEQLSKPKPVKSVTFSPLEVPKENGSAWNLAKENKKPDDIAPLDTAKSTQVTKAPQPPESKQPEKPAEVQAPPIKVKEDEFNDPYFSNHRSIQEFIRIQQLLEQTREKLTELNNNASLKPFKNELNLFIRTQINSISNSDTQHLDNKVRLMSDLFNGKAISFQDRLVDATKHPNGQLLAMDLAAQTFVTVGTRLVNSVPAIAKSMATVINRIVAKNLNLFKELLIGHLQERCPYLIPMNPRASDFEQTVQFKIACGYLYDSKTQALEAEEKYLTRMRSMVLIYACVLVDGDIGQSWTWLAAFLSLKPEPVITATILQAFLQESSKKLSSTYGVQYDKLLAFIKDPYAGMIEEITPKTSDRQSFIKLKNLLADSRNLTAAPAMSSIFGAIRSG